MKRPYRRLLILIALAMPLCLDQAKPATDNFVQFSMVKPNLALFTTAAGNVVASVGPDGALIIGAVSSASTEEISKILDAHTKSPMRYVVVEPESPSTAEGDAGWGKRGAFVAMHENALMRIGGDRMDVPAGPDPRLTKLGVDRPRIAFSEVLAFDLNGEAIHVVHQTPGYSDADSITHFHAASLVYLGQVFPGDGYPVIDSSQHGKLDGLIKTLSAWTGSSIGVIPYRGPITDGKSVEAFRDMIVSVRDKVRSLIDRNLNEEQIVSSRPTKQFDDRWGKGRVSPDAFVREIYKSIKEE